jgi:hypothetical protein
MKWLPFTNFMESYSQDNKDVKVENNITHPIMKLYLVKVNMDMHVPTT